MDEYIFPFNTCESVNKNGIAQPYSVFFNLINCAMVIYFLCKTKNKYTFVLLLSLLCFELFHTFSHAVHINGSMQINITHTLTYFMNIAFFCVFYNYTNIFPTYGFRLYILLLVFLDIYSLLRLTIIYYLLTQSLIFISLLLYYYNFLPKYIQNSIYSIIFFVCTIIVLFLNEKYNCNVMMSINKHFPYHIFIEIIGIILFYIIGSNFYKL